MHTENENGRGISTARWLIQLTFIVVTFNSALLAANYMFDGLFQPNGVSPVELIVTAATFITFWASLSALHAIGLFYLPGLPDDERQGKVGMWLVAVILVIIASFGLSFPSVALDAAREADLQQKISASQNSIEEVMSAQRTIDGWAAPLSDRAEATMEMARLELAQGSICRAGSGEGECHAALLMLSSVAESSSQNIDDAKFDSDPAMKKMQAALRNFSRIATDESLEYEQRFNLLQAEVVNATEATTIVQNGLAIGPLRAVTDAFSTDFRGVASRIGARVISNEHAPIGARIAADLEKVAPVTEYDIPSLERTSDWVLLWRYLPDNWILALFVLLLDVLPFVLSFILIGASRDDGASRSDDRNDYDDFDDDVPFGNVRRIH